MDVLQPSQEFARAKQQLLSAVADAFGWDANGSQMNPPPGVYEAGRAKLQKPFHTVGERDLREPPPMRSNLQRLPGRLYNERRPGGTANTNYLKTPDASHIDLVCAIYDQYVLCNHWDEVAEGLYKAGKHGEREMPHQRQIHAIESVRAQIGPYYAHLLKERGMSDAEAMKIVGHAIYAFTESATTQQRPVVVNPEKGIGKTPGVLIEQITNYARVTRDSAKVDQINARS